MSTTESQVPNQETPLRVSGSKRFLRLVRNICLALLFFLTITLGTIFLWIHNIQSAPVLADWFNKAVGSAVQLETLYAPLPNGFEVQGLVISDPQGAWLRIEEASLAWDWRALLNGTFKLNSVHVAEVTVLRLPAYPASTTVQPSTDDNPWYESVLHWPKYVPSLAINNMTINNIHASAAVWHALDMASKDIPLQTSQNAPLPLPQLNITANDLSLKPNDQNIPALHATLHAEFRQLGVFFPLEQSALEITLSGAAINPTATVEIQATGVELEHVLSVQTSTTQKIPPKSTITLHSEINITDIINPNASLYLEVQCTDLPQTLWFEPNAQATLTGRVQSKDERLRLDDVVLDSSFFHAEGFVDLPLKASLFTVEGHLQATLPDLSKLHRLQRDLLPRKGQIQAIVHVTPQQIADSTNDVPSEKKTQEEIKEKQIKRNTKTNTSARAFATESLQGQVVIHLNDMDWGTNGLAALQPLFGKKSDLQTAFAFKQTETKKEYTLALSNTTLNMQAGHLTTKGTAAFKPSGEVQLDVGLTAALKSLTPWVTDVDGRLNGTARVHGNMFLNTKTTQHIAQENLQVEFKLSSDTLRVAQQAFTDITAQAALSGVQVGKIQRQGMQGLSGLRGLIQASGTSAEFGLVSANTNAEVLHSDGKDTLFLRQLAVNGLGVVLQGAGQAVLPTVSSIKTPKITGQVSGEVQDWQAISAFIGATKAEKAAFELLFANKEGKQHVSTTCDIQQFEHVQSGLELAHATLKGQADDLFGALTAEIDGSVGRGRIGYFAQDEGVQRLWREGTLQGSFADGQGRLQAALLGPIGFTLESVFDLQRVTLETLNAQWDKTQKIELVNPVTIQMVSAENISVSPFELRISPRGNIKGNMGLVKNNLDMDVRIESLPLFLFQPLLEMPLPQGFIHAEMALNGTVAQPEGSAHIILDTLHNSGISSSEADTDNIIDTPSEETNRLQTELTASLHKGETSLPLVLRMTRKDGDTAKVLPLLEGMVRLPLRYVVGSVPLPDLESALQGQLSWQGDLATIWDFIPLSDFEATGDVDLTANISGTIHKPHVEAEVDIEGARLASVPLGFELVNVDIEGRLPTSGVLALQAKAHDVRGGSLVLNGTVDFFGGTQAIEAALQTKAFAPLSRNDVRVLLNTALSASGTLSEPHVSGKMQIDYGEVRINAFSSSVDIPTLPVINAEAPLKEEVEKEDVVSEVGTIDVVIEVPNQLFVRGLGLESEWKGNLTLQGALNRPTIVGDITSVRGQLDLLGTSFMLEHGFITFPGSWPPLPLLDVALTHPTADITANVLITGSALRPRLRLESQPSLPQNEIVSYILFGRSAAGLSQTEALRLAAAVVSLGLEGNGPSLFELTKNVFGVDVFRLGQTDQEQTNQTNNPFSGPSFGTADEEDAINTTLEMGKYLFDNVYVGVEQGIAPDSTGAVVEIELTPNLDVTAKSTPKDSTFGLNWLWDY